MYQLKDELKILFNEQQVNMIKSRVISVLLYLLCISNLLFMHYSVTGLTGAEYPFTFYDYVDNMAGVVLDVTLLLLFFLCLTGRRLKCSLLCTYIVTMVWAFSNILYSRFFNQYMSWSAIKQASNLATGFMIDCIGEELAFGDLIFVASLTVFLLLYRLARPIKLSPLSMLGICLLPLLSLCCNLWTVSVVASTNSYDHSFWGNMKSRLYSSQQIVLMPQLRTFESGSLRVLAISAWNDIRVSHVLDREERNRIGKEYKDHKLRKTGRRQRVDVRNVIYIIVESYLSFTSDLTVGGVEVTPNLNALKRDSNVYYNARMHPNVEIGASSDGQFIYMTGLLPLKSTITVDKAKGIALPGLATCLKRAFPGMKARMIIPTTASFWCQSDMCRQYGFDDLYDAKDYSHGEYTSLNDEQVFDMAMEKDNISSGPFLSVVLTVSMHMPYDNPIENADTVLRDKSLPEKLCNYLTAVHYTDKQIGRYLEHLKKNGLYENSLIVITSDHSVKSHRLGLPDKASLDIPLYIVNGDMDRNSAYCGPCNQLDVYTTLLDVLAVDEEWLGLGHTLLNKNYVSSVNEHISKISEAIICSDYLNEDM